MQLEAEKPQSALRDALHTAALALLLVPGTAKAQSEEPTTDKLEFTTLFYNEESRTQVIEPVVRFTHLFPDGGSVSAQLIVDSITGASPTGALPSGIVQTHTTPSGHVVSSDPGEIPLTSFSDRRYALDAEWRKPLGRLVVTKIGGHYSTEKDYDSVGANASISTDLMNRLLTLTLGGGISRDSVSPVGGTPYGLSDGTIVSNASNSKDVTNLVFGASRILSRRWMVGLNGTQTWESGYLTEPYKLISVMDSVTGQPLYNLTDKRPTTRDRTSLLFSSVYHLTDDIVYGSYRYYQDTWGVRSHTFDLKYRMQFDDSYLEPLARYYTQSGADFFTVGLTEGAQLPDFATADYRLGNLQTITLGATYGIRTDLTPGEWTVRAQFIRQSGDSSPPNAIGIQKNFDLAPPVNIFGIVVGYTFDY